MEFDRKLEISVLPPAPALHVSFSAVPQEILAGEIIPITVHLTNAGVDGIGSVYVASELPRCILGDLPGQELPLSVLRDFKDLTNEALSRDKEARKQHVFALLKPVPGIGSVALMPNESKVVTIWLQAPYKKGPTDIKLLIYYTMPNNYPKIRFVKSIGIFVFR